MSRLVRTVPRATISADFAKRTFPLACVAAGLPEPVEEHGFALPKRKWRIDYAWPDKKVGLEVDGGVWMKGGGRHTRGSGWMKDTEKLNEAAALGWRIVRVTPAQLLAGQTMDWIRRAMEAA